MAEYSRIAKGSFTASGTSAVINLPFQPDFVELWNYTNIKTAGNNLVTRAWWDNRLADSSNNPTMVESYNNSGVVVFDSILTGGISSFYAGLGQQYGTTFQITGITKASSAVVTTSTAHGYSVGQTVIMQGIATSITTNAMRLLNGVPFTITAVGSTTTFTINWDTTGSNYTAISGSPTGCLVKQVLYPFLYVPEDNVISAITTGTTTTIATTMYHNFETGQQVAFRVPSSWGTTQLNSLPNNVIPGSPIYGYVISITDNYTFVVNINSSSYTAYNTNPSTVSAGLSYAQVLAVGDVNTGGNAISSVTTTLYPPPQFPTSSSRVPSINGPAIRGSFVNNTSQGFLIGTGVGNTNASLKLLANSNIVYYRAYLSDYANP